VFSQTISFNILLYHAIFLDCLAF